jgi:arylsulfatase A-like enzyme
LRLGERWWRDRADEPRFLFINLIDAHDPYEPKSVDLRRYVPTNPAAARAVSQDVHAYYLGAPLPEDDAYTLRALYDAEVAGMDRELGRFFQRTALAGDLDDAVVVITSDHGERLGETGVLGHSLTMDHYVLQIPLVVRLQSTNATGIVARRVTTRYLPSYFSDLAGVHEQPFGRPERLPVEDAPYAVAQLRESTWFIDQLLARDPSFDASPFRGNRCFVTDGEYAYRSISGDDPRKTLIHLPTDPDWTDNLESDLPEVTERFEEVVETLPPFGDTASEDIDPAARERLRALGYVD